MGELVVDGYNVLHAFPELAQLMRRGRGDEARDRLVAMLAQYAAATGEVVTVVFDAHGRAGEVGRGETVDGVRVLFGTTTQSADHVIERRVAVAARQQLAGAVTVATSDRLQRDMVVAMGAAVIGAQALREVMRGVEGELAGQNDARRRQARLGSRLEDGLNPDVRRRLEEMRRGGSPKPGSLNNH